MTKAEAKAKTMRAIEVHCAKHNLSLRELCALADVHYVTVWRWGQSQTTPRPRTVAALLAAHPRTRTKRLRQVP
jgi:hypothetical protein